MPDGHYFRSEGLATRLCIQRACVLCSGRSTHAPEYGTRPEGERPCCGKATTKEWQARPTSLSMTFDCIIN
jgi:hypothetical protein